MIIEKLSNNKISITVSDPMQNPKLKEVTITTSLNITDSSSKKVNGKNVFTIALPTAVDCGRSITKMFEQK